MNRIFIPLFLFCAIFFLSPQLATAITIDTVPVGNPGNAPDQNFFGQGQFGAVAYSYRIGKTEVTVGQYTAFLNAVAATDTYGLYNTQMATIPWIAGISQSGASGSYSYSVIGSANKPIAEISWGDAARFCNWLNNGQPSGGQVAGTTEDGAYTLNGAVSVAALSAVTRNAGAKWFLPTENEWYKAAYHKNNGPTSDYWTYPTGTNSEPNSDQPPGDPSIQTNVANFVRDDGLANGYNDGYAVTGSTSSSGMQNYLTDVGAYTSAPSPYGTFDQGGNLYEWNETFFSDNSFRGFRGGSWKDFDGGSQALRSSRRVSGSQTFHFYWVGFRVASVIPEPTSLCLAVLALAGALLIQRRQM
jgi:formylglycine-generating enzyme